MDPQQQDVEMAQPSAEDLVAMPVRAPPTRVTLDANDLTKEIVDSKKVQVPQEPEKKRKVILFIAQSHKKLLIDLKLSAEALNLSIGDQVHNILFTGYTILRQRANGTNGTLAARIGSAAYQVTAPGATYNITKQNVEEILVAQAALAGLEFKKYAQDDPGNWYGIANPLLNFLSGFALRRKELRLGHHIMPVGKKNNKEEVVNLSQFGIYGCHHILCEGVSFPPEKRASMPQTLGPIATLLCYLKSDRMYEKKWEVAVKRAFAHFPDIDTVMSVLKAKIPSEGRSLVTLICDIALITTTRQATRMFPPPAAFSYIFTQPEHKVSGSVYKTTNLIPNFNFSGHGAWAFYKIFQSIQWTMYLNINDESIAKQICYHSMFGTFKEDLSLLSQITTQANWYTREQMAGAFKKANTEGKKVTFDPVEQKYFSKLAQANMTGLLTTSYSQMSSLPCFSGKTKRKFADAFFDHLAETSGRTMGGKSMQALIATYSQIKEELRQYLEKNDGKITTGTTEWYNMNDITVTLVPLVPVNITPETTGKFFLGKN
uniref:Nucleoprotein n=1 Tax=Hymenopteran orthomyxo-related virus OKIAV171 TaxID=2792557 RepID=A0A7T0M3P1_9ORTO|nr:nucleoprotein [Hymenopteran orthomyxo-related virus OKIAV171]